MAGGLVRRGSETRSSVCRHLPSRDREEAVGQGLFQHPNRAGAAAFRTPPDKDWSCAPSNLRDIQLDRWATSDAA